MKAFADFSALAVPLRRPNIDTDQIIPKQFLRSVKRVGFGVFLFNDWRYLGSADLDSDLTKQPLNPDFVLNSLRYAQAEILLAGANFGCGSSREHAVWALQEYGFRAIIGPSFSDIFRINAAQNSLLLAVVADSDVATLATACAATENYRLTINLEGQKITTPDDLEYPFEIEPATKQRLLDGLDDIALTLKMENRIRTYEEARKQAEPWLFSDRKDA